MLQITIPGTELWDEENGEFVSTKETTLNLEHSLLSLSRWESKWNKAFLSKDNKTLEETRSYIQCMTLNKNVDPEVYKCLSRKNFDEVNEYISAPMTATHFSQLQERKGGFYRETVTSELIYYWMVSLGIPFECQKWHLNRLITLIKVCNIKNTPPKKMSRNEIASRNARLNAARRAKLHSKG